MSLKRLSNRLLKKVGLLHNTLVMVGWLYMKLLMLYYFYKQLYNGFKLDFTLLNTMDMWDNIALEFKVMVALNSVNLLFLLDNKRERKAFLSLLFHHSKAALMYFVTYKVLGEDLNLRWSLVNLTLLTLLNILESLNRFNLYIEQRNEFLEWLYHKVFLFLYPLLTVSELMLVTSSFHFLRRFEKYKLFPSAMPNRYNFYVNLHLLYKFLPAPLAVFSAVFYFNKCRYT